MAGGMPEMQNLDDVGGLLNAILDEDRGVHQLAHAGSFVHRAAYVRETFQQTYVVKSGIAEPFG